MLARRVGLIATMLLVRSSMSNNDDGLSGAECKLRSWWGQGMYADPGLRELSAYITAEYERLFLCCEPCRVGQLVADNLIETERICDTLEAECAEVTARLSEVAWMTKRPDGGLQSLTTAVTPRGALFAFPNFHLAFTCSTHLAIRPQSTISPQLSCLCPCAPTYLDGLQCDQNTLIPTTP